MDDATLDSLDVQSLLGSVLGKHLLGFYLAFLDVLLFVFGLMKPSFQMKKREKKKTECRTT